jgi:hypothetical protein
MLKLILLLLTLLDYQTAYQQIKKSDGWVRITKGEPIIACFSICKSGNNLIIGGVSREMSSIFYTDEKEIEWKTSGYIGDYATSFLSHKGFLLAGTKSKGILKSTNDGKTWFATNGLTPNGVISLIEHNNIIVAGTTSGLIYISSNDGIDWELRKELNRTINCIVSSFTYLFVATCDIGIIYSSDNGYTFDYLIKGQESPRGDFHSLIIYNRKIYTGSHSDGVHIFNLSDFSSDGWYYDFIGINNSPCLNSLLKIEKYLIGGTEGCGIFILPDDKTEWIDFRQGIENQNVKCLLKGKEYIYAGVIQYDRNNQSYGIYRRKINELFEMN